MLNVTLIIFGMCLGALFFCKLLANTSWPSISNLTVGFGFVRDSLKYQLYPFLGFFELLAGWAYTLPETNIFAPENGWLEYAFPFGRAYFQGLC